MLIRRRPLSCARYVGPIIGGTSPARPAPSGGLFGLAFCLSNPLEWPLWPLSDGSTPSKTVSCSVVSFELLPSLGAIGCPFQRPPFPAYPLRHARCPWCITLVNSPRRPCPPTTGSQVCGIATGSPTKLPLFSPALYKHSQIKSAPAAPAPELAKPGPVPAGSGMASRLLRQLASRCVTTPLAIVARQRQRLRRFKRRIAGQGAVDRCLPVGTGGAYVWWGFHPRSRRWGLVRRGFGEAGFGGGRGMGNGSTVEGTWRGASPTRAASPGEGSRIGVAGEEAKAVGRLFTRGDSGSSSPGPAMRQASPMHEGIVGHVWVSLKLRDPSMMMMRAVRRWNMTRDEASEEQRRMARAEAKR